MATSESVVFGDADPGRMVRSLLRGRRLWRRPPAVDGSRVASVHRSNQVMGMRWLDTFPWKVRLVGESVCDERWVEYRKNAGER